MSVEALLLLALCASYALLFAAAGVRTLARRYKLKKAIKRGEVPAWIGGILMD